MIYFTTVYQDVNDIFYVTANFNEFLYCERKMTHLLASMPPDTNSRRALSYVQLPNLIAQCCVSNGNSST